MFTRFLLQTRRPLAQQSLRLVAPTSRMIHSRGYTIHEDNDAHIFHEINFALNNSKNTKNLTFIY